MDGFGRKDFIGGTLSQLILVRWSESNSPGATEQVPGVSSRALSLLVYLPIFIVLVPADGLFPRSMVKPANQAILSATTESL